MGPYFESLIILIASAFDIAFAFVFAVKDFFLGYGDTVFVRDLFPAGTKLGGEVGGTSAMVVFCEDLV